MKFAPELRTKKVLVLKDHYVPDCGYLIASNDGPWHWQTASCWQKYSAYDLRVIADKLDQLNNGEQA